MQFIVLGFFYFIPTSLRLHTKTSSITLEGGGGNLRNEFFKKIVLCITVQIKQVREILDRSKCI